MHENEHKTTLISTTPHTLQNMTSAKQLFMDVLGVRQLAEQAGLDDASADDFTCSLLGQDMGDDEAQNFQLIVAAAALLPIVKVRVHLTRAAQQRLKDSTRMTSSLTPTATEWKDDDIGGPVNPIQAMFLWLYMLFAQLVGVRMGPQVGHSSRSPSSSRRARASSTLGVGELEDLNHQLVPTERIVEGSVC
jgi:hypothetical protein